MATILDSNLFPLGVIRPTPGVPSNIFTNYPDFMTQDTLFHGSVNLLLFQADPKNKGAAYIGTFSLDKTQSLTNGIIYTLMAGGDSFSIASPNTLNVFMSQGILIDVDNAGDGVQVTFYVR